MKVGIRHTFKQLALSLSLGAFALSLAGCSGKALTKPRSELIEEANSAGAPARSVHEDRKLFLAYDKTQKNRLLSLVRTRSRGESHDKNYRFGPDDEVELNVFDVPELNVTAKIRQSGFLNLPLIGAVKAAGLTETQLTGEVTRRLGSYVRNPQVSVFVSHYGSQKVAVMGAVRTPGTYALQKGANSLVELLSQAGGISDKAGNFVIFIPAELTGLGADNDIEARAKLALTAHERPSVKASGIEVYLDQVLGTSGGIPLEIPIRGGDTIVVPEAGKVMVEGEVEKPGSYELSQQMTLLGALASAGGVTYGAKPDEVEIVRDLEGNQRVGYVIDLKRIGTGEERDVRLHNGDIVRVPSHSGRRMSQDTFEGIAKIINFGIGGSVSLVP